MVRKANVFLAFLVVDFFAAGFLGRMLGYGYFGRGLSGFSRLHCFGRLGFCVRLGLASGFVFFAGAGTGATGGGTAAAAASLLGFAFEWLAWYLRNRGRRGCRRGGLRSASTARRWRGWRRRRREWL